MWHTFVQLGFSFFNMFLTFFVFSFVNTRMDILESFGYTEHYNIIALTVFMEIYKPVSKVITFVHFYIT